MKKLPKDVSLASFDFIGCGTNWEDDTVSLGFREAQQTRTVAEHLRLSYSKVILWGRSMGAAASLLYGDAEFIVADSSFKSFESLCKQVAKNHVPKNPFSNMFISCIFPCAYSKLRTDVEKRAKYDTDVLNVKEAVKRLSPDTTVVFMTGEDDALVAASNSKKLYDACTCHKKLIEFKGGHNSKRPDMIMAEVMALIEDYIHGKQLSEVSSSEVINPYSEGEENLYSFKTNRN
jgi:fermentation-respiration switch protein FrsA (DUF1100 family)